MSNSSVCHFQSTLFFSLDISFIHSFPAERIFWELLYTHVYHHFSLSMACSPYWFSCNFTAFRAQVDYTKPEPGADPRQTSSAFSNAGTRWTRKEAWHMGKGSDYGVPVKSSEAENKDIARLALISCTSQTFTTTKVSWPT